MGKERIYLSPPFISDREIHSVADTLRNGWVAPVGPELDQFEKNLEKNFGFPKVLCLQSGTSALHLAVKLAGVGRGDKVLIGTFTFIAAANAVLYEGGIPVFMDSDPHSWNLDPDLLTGFLDKQCTINDLPKAVIVTHIFGRPSRIKAIKEVCHKYGVKLIEDAAEALASEYFGKYLGSWGDFGVLSFNGNKILTTGGGGGLVCQNEADYQRAKFWATQSKENTVWYSHTEIGYNYRMSNVLAGIGIAQLDRLEVILKRKKEINEFYVQNLAGELFEFPAEIEHAVSNHWLTTLLIKEEFIHRLTPNDLILALEKENIEARMYWKPLHTQPLFEKAEFIGEQFVAENLFKRGICLPSGVGLSTQDQGRVIECILKKVNS